MNSSYKFLIIITVISPTWGFLARWEVGPYGPCSISCGRGLQTRPVACKRASGVNKLSDSLCPSQKPPSMKICAAVACIPEWSVNRWHECSKTCGRGFQHREVHCCQRLANGMVTFISEDYCPRGRPPKKRRCGMSDCPARYSAKKWTTCSASCGGGVQFRPVLCMQVKAGAHGSQVIATDYCSHLVPLHRKRRCNQNQCPGSEHSVQNRRRTGRFRNIDLDTYFRARKPYKVWSPGALRRDLQSLPVGSADSHQIRRKSSFLGKRKVSRRRSITIDKKKLLDDCKNISAKDANASRVDSQLLFPCFLRRLKTEDASRGNHKYETISSRLHGTWQQDSKFSRPFIVTRADVIAPLFPPTVVHVGGVLTISNTDTTTLLCEAIGYPPPITQWSKDGSLVVESDRLAISRENSQRESSLRFIQPVRSDSGTYSCVARNSAGESSVNTTVNVVTEPEIQTLETADALLKSRGYARIGSVIKARSGVAIRISCPVSGFPPPRIRWDKEITGLGENARILSDDSLKIYPSTLLDQGIYSCEATNPVGADYRTSTLVLFEPPDLQQFLNRPETLKHAATGLPRLLLATEDTPIYVLDVNGSALIGCPLFGKGEVTWTYDNLPIERSGLQFRILVDGMVLLIEVINAKSSGVFSCHSLHPSGGFTAGLEIRLAKYTFVPDGLTECTHSCGGNGMQHASLRCVRDGRETVPERYCTGVPLPNLHTEACNRIDCQPNLHIESWSPCSKTCGEGKRSRKVSCLVLQANSSLREVSSTLCFSQLQSAGSEPEIDSTARSIPIGEEPCLLSECPKWRVGTWSPCGEKCYGLGVGMRMRQLYCNVNGTSVSRTECLAAPRPKWRELCFTKRCDPVWTVSKWSACSRTCGDSGIQSRILNCVFRGNRRQRARNLCNNALRPQVSMPCRRRPC